MSNLLESVKSVHCVGVKGIGLSALAQILAARGLRVTGSDAADPFPADEALQRAGIRIRRGFRASHVSKNCDLVIASNAYLSRAWNMKHGTWNNDRRRALIHDPSSMNAEVREAGRRGIPVVSYPEAVAELFNKTEKGIAVAGSHGKSTTSALLGVVLENLGYDPTVITGAVVKNWASNARSPRNTAKSYAKQREKYFVLEADEYRWAFLQYRSFGAIVTSVDWDHPDVFPTRASYTATFRAFARRINPHGFLIINGDDPSASGIRKATTAGKVLMYGKGSRNILRLTSFRQTPRGIVFRAALRGRPVGEYRIRLFGEHHAFNALAVIGVCLMLGEKPDRIRKALAQFEGTQRRFDILSGAGRRGTTQKPLRRYSITALRPIIIDDYAHHPAEIRATIAAARAAFPKRRIRALFQPHTFSRTAAYFNDFVDALRKADEVAILKTYASAREKPQAKGRSEALAQALGVRHFATHAAAIAHYAKTLGPKDVFMALGAGDGDRVAQKLSATISR